MGLIWSLGLLCFCRIAWRSGSAWVYIVQEVGCEMLTLKSFR